MYGNIRFVMGTITCVRAIVCPELPGETDRLMIIFSPYISPCQSITNGLFIECRWQDEKVDGIT